jgi:acyl carrier protein
LLYWTGDIGYLRADGLLQVVGRRDNQVKVRGARVEPAEIELAISDHPDVAAAAVVDHLSEDGVTYLVAYVVFRPHVVVREKLVRRFVARRLPPYMVPAAFIAVESLPRTPSGKTDRNALPKPGTPAATLSDPAEQPPKSTTEIALAEIWSGLLGVSPTLEDGFFDLGGHSLLAGQLLSVVQQKFDVELALRAVFDGQSLQEMAQAVDILTWVRSNRSAGPEVLEDCAEEGEL